MMDDTTTAQTGSDAHAGDLFTPTDRLRMTACASPIDLSAFDIPHDDPFVCRTTVENWQTSGVIPHVSNILYVAWLDRAAQLHSDSLGYTRKWLLERQMMWFVGRHEIDYLAEAWVDDELLVITWVRNMRRVKSWRDYVIVRPGDKTVIARAATLWVLVDLDSRRPRRVDAEMIRLFAPLHEREARDG